MTRGEIISYYVLGFIIWGLILYGLGTVFFGNNVMAWPSTLRIVLVVAWVLGSVNASEKAIDNKRKKQ